MDRGEGYVVPPFGEAHNHNPGNPPQPKQVEKYLQDGVFYVMVQNNRPPPDSVDMKWIGPIDDFVNVRRIKLRVKNGAVLESPIASSDPQGG